MCRCIGNPGSDRRWIEPFNDQPDCENHLLREYRQIENQLDGTEAGDDMEHDQHAANGDQGNANQTPNG